MKKQEIVDGDWDYLIILDACRYDDFEEFYSKYLEGKLKKRLSRGSNTPEWLAKTFPSGKYNITYISANPYVNGQGWSLEKLRRENYNWNAKDKFKEVVDVWESRWSDKKGTVHPKKLVKEALKTYTKDNLIIHFMQPHRPYLTAPFDKRPLKNEFLLKFTTPIRPIWFKLPNNTRIKLKKKIGLKPGMNKKTNKKDIDTRTLRKYYRKNLEIALKHVKDLAEKLPEGKMVITSDHGEAFGEEGVFQHPPNRKLPVLVEVPWLELKTRGKKGQVKKRKIQKKQKSSEKEIKKRLEELGYET